MGGPDCPRFSGQTESVSGTLATRRQAIWQTPRRQPRDTSIQTQRRSKTGRLDCCCSVAVDHEEVETFYDLVYCVWMAPFAQTGSNPDVASEGLRNSKTSENTALPTSPVYAQRVKSHSRPAPPSPLPFFAALCCSKALHLPSISFHRP
jgi:hypothetical protein